MIYLDNAATTKVDKIVLNEMLPFLMDNFGNPSSQHELGRTAKKHINIARERVAKLINADPSNIIFTSSGSESNIMALHMLNNKNGITSCMEHDSILENISKDVSVLPYMERDKLIKYLESNNNYEFISIMFVNNELGIINPIEEIGNICKSGGKFFHTDCVQALGHEIIDVNKIQCDLLSISSHKIHGPKGVGALYVRTPNSKMAIFNGSQEFGMRGGTENVPGIVGFGKACELIYNNFDLYQSHLLKLRNNFIKNLKCNYVLNYDNLNNNILSIRFIGIDSETLIFALSSQGVYVSSGSACKNLNQEPSKVLINFGLTETEARETIRVSLSRENTLEEVIEAAKIITQTVKYLEG